MRGVPLRNETRHGLNPDLVHMLMPIPPRPRGRPLTDMGPLQRVLAEFEETGSDLHAAARQEVEAAALQCLDANSKKGEDAAEYLATAPADGSVELWVEHELSIAEAIGRIEAGANLDAP